MPTTAQETIVRESPEIEAYRLGLLKLAKARGSKPIDLPDQQIAGLTEDQNQAIGMANAGLGAYQPYMNQANAYMGQAGAGFGQVAGTAQNAVNGALAANQGYTSTALQQQAAQSAGAQGANTAYSNAGLAANQGYTTAGMLNGITYGQQGLAAGQTGNAALNESRGLAGLAGQYAGQGQSQVVNPAAAGAGIGTLAGFQGAQNFNPNSTQNFMNGYTQDVIDRSMNEIEHQAAGARQTSAGNAVSRGAYGGSRDAVQRAELERGIIGQKANTIAQLNSQNYGQAQAAAMSDQQNTAARMQQAGNMAMQGGQMQSQAGLASLGLGANTAMQGAQTLGNQGLQNASTQQQGALSMGQYLGNMGLQAGQQAGTLGLQAGQQAGQLGMQSAHDAGIMGLQAGQQAGQLGIAGGQLASSAMLDANRGIAGLAQTAGTLGGLQQSYGQADSSFLYNMGANQQKQQQAQLDATYNNQMAQAYEPFQRIGFMNDIYSKVPTSQQTLNSSTTPDPSAASQIVGAGIAGYGALNAFNKAASPFGS
jgi:hypothetical protein